MKQRTTAAAAEKLNKAIGPTIAKFAPPAPGSEEEAQAIEAGNRIFDRATSCPGSGIDEEGRPAE